MIPTGYSVEFWDPDEEPVLLFATVFDANSLGRWIYDWAGFFYGYASPLAEVAGDLWVLLLELSYKIKQAEDFVNGNCSASARNTLEEYLDSGERIWQRFNQLLQICEQHARKATRREAGSDSRVTVDRNQGLAFVECMFDQVLELSTTEEVMQCIRYWLLRYNANCLPFFGKMPTEGHI